MSRIRTVKPEFFKHEDLFDAEEESGLPLRLAFISLWTVADRDGRFKWRPRTLKVECLPHDECDFSLVLDALWTRGFIVKYAVNGETFGAVPSFGRHQVINNRESPSILPEPNDNNVLTRGARADDGLRTPLVQDQGEGKGREQEGEGDRDPNGSLADADAPTIAVNLNRSSKKRTIEMAALHLLGSDWNSLAASCGLAQIGAIKSFSPREKSALARIRDEVDWPDIFTKIRGSPFLLGKTTDFQITFDWMTNPTNLQKIIEGNYNREIPKDQQRPKQHYYAAR